MLGLSNFKVDLTAKRGIGVNMTDNEAYKLIGERAQELSKRADVQKKMVEIAHKDGKAEAEKWLYRCAIATLI